MPSIHTSHRMVFWIPALMYLVLVALCAVWPAEIELAREAKAEKPIVDDIVARGRRVFRSYNCGCCHTMQVRGDEHLAYEREGRLIVPPLKADERYGDEATNAASYDYEDPAMLGTQRTGPDLFNVGLRLPGRAWHHWHLYNPRAVSPDSVMPAYRFLYTTEPPPADDAEGYEPVEVIQGLGVTTGTLWATPDAVALVEYLLALDGGKR